MGTELVPVGQYQTFRRTWRRLVQTARLCCGVPDYDNYVRTPRAGGGRPLQMLAGFAAHAAPTRGRRQGG